MLLVGLQTPPSLPAEGLSGQLWAGPHSPRLPSPSEGSAEKPVLPTGQGEIWLDLEQREGCSCPARSSAHDSITDQPRRAGLGAPKHHRREEACSSKGNRQAGAGQWLRGRGSEVYKELSGLKLANNSIFQTEKGWEQTLHQRHGPEQTCGKALTTVGGRGNAVNQ